MKPGIFYNHRDAILYDNIILAYVFILCGSNELVAASDGPSRFYNSNQTPVKGPQKFWCGSYGHVP